MNSDILNLLRWRDTEEIRREYHRAREIAEAVGPAKEYPFAYYSLLRPLDVWFEFNRKTEWVVGRFLFATKPIALDRMVQFTLAPCVPNAWVDAMKQVYTREFGTNPAVWCLERVNGEEHMVFFKSGEDRWTIHFFDENGITQTTWLVALEACLNRAFLDDFSIPKSPETWDRYRSVWAQVEG